MKQLCSVSSRHIPWRGLPLLFLFFACDSSQPSQPDLGIDLDQGEHTIDSGLFPDLGSPDLGVDTKAADLEEGELLPGGATTTEETGRGAFVQQAANLSVLRRASFAAGLQFFILNWVPAPGRPEIDGLGPTYNAVSCIACHERNGRGLPQTNERFSPGVLLRLASDTGEPDPNYGGQLQPLSIPGVPSEARMRRETIPTGSFVFADSSSISLQLVRYSLDQLRFGPLAPKTRISPRISPQLVGMGLLEAIDEADLRRLADPDDSNKNGISGRLAILGNGKVGRFGWKAGQDTVLSQSAGAFLGDMGLTSPLNPQENCPTVQSECQNARHGGAPELPAERLEATAAYLRLLAVPERRKGHTEHARKGKTLFTQLGCAQCHHPSYLTTNSLEPELSNQKIWPYTDLLLHDMGDQLADGQKEGAAEVREWRTPPLWGLGLIETVNGKRYLLHDGRAQSIAEAIAWHGGEATVAREAYRRLNETERNYLNVFIESL